MRAPGRSAALVCLVGLAVAACRTARPISPVVPTPTMPALAAVPVMGPARLTAAQLAAWFQGRQPQPAGAYAATVPLDALARHFIEEGAAEGVAGDVAFVQSVFETGWFRFNGTVPARMNNFAGIGASDDNPAPARFPTAQIGVRAQIQHLRAYADAAARSCTVPPLRNPCADPRFDLVVPKGKAPTWIQMGSGNWATFPNYGASVLALYAEALAYSGVR
jgi:hypothetical protein